MSEPPLSRAAQARTWLPFGLVVLIWGSTWFVIRGQLGVVPPIWSVTYRFALAAIVMLGWAVVTRAPLRIGGRDAVLVAMVGVCQFVINFNLVYLAEGYITSGLVAVVFGLLIVPNAILGRLVLGHGISRRFFAGSAIAIAGIALLFLHESGRAGIDGGALRLGIIYTLGAVLGASVANIAQALPRAQAMPMAVMLGWAMAAGAAVNAMLAWTIAGPPVFDTSPAYVWGLVYLVLFASVLAFWLYYGIIRSVGPARAAYTSVLIPVIAMTISTLFEGYRWSPTAAAGVALVLAGLVVALRARSPAR